MIKVNPGTIKDIKKYGAFDINACFNCGNCTAVCPLSDENSSFPRKLIRTAHLGAKDRLLAAKEPWMCYYCGECSKTCPREAKPGAFMAAMRRYAIAHNDFTGFTKVLYKSWGFNLVFSLVITFIFALYMYGKRLEGRGGEKVIEVFNIPFHLVHDLGIVVMAAAGLALAGGFIMMLLRYPDLKAALGLAKEKGMKGISLLAAATSAAVRTAFLEMLAFRRFRECDKDKELAEREKPWLIHALTAWGFMGLFLATVLDFLFKDPEALVPLWYPPRLIGTIAGISLMWGTTRLMLNRARKDEPAYANSVFSDWLFLAVLWFVGLTGFILEILVYLPQGALPQHVLDLLFVVHVAPAMTLVVMAAFTKLAHVFYRPMALFLHDFKEQVRNMKKGRADEDGKR